MKKIKNILKNIIPRDKIIKYFNYYVVIVNYWKGYKIEYSNSYIGIMKNRREIRIPLANRVYLKDTLDNFEFYFSAVLPELNDGIQLVDFSRAKRHWVKGFRNFEIEFPSVAEPADTINQYIEFARFKPGSVALDIGAYSGLTSILFDMAIENGRVVAIEADEANVASCKNNFLTYENYSSRSINLIEAAVWKDNDGILFSSEGSMGSSAVDIVGHGRGSVVKVHSITLDQIVRQQGLDRIDFIKCDIEGGEINIFDNPLFFSSFSPKIVIECHYVDGSLTYSKCEKILAKYGYDCKMYTQLGYPLPLLFATRNNDYLNTGYPIS